jgi:D-sedoheptulose 7-phosphate isomerase
VTGDPTDFLYPFIEAEHADASLLLADLATSAEAKIVASRALRAATLECCTDDVERAGVAMARRLGHGGRLLCFGNGGSATDAEAMATLFQEPPSGMPLTALSLAGDSAVLTALANDVGFDVVFSRQITAYGRPEDIAVGFSTSGDSINVVRALEEGARRGLLTVGLCGYDGGAMARSDAVRHCLVVRSDSVHRIQETQAALVRALWSTVQRWMDDGIGS